MANVSIKDSEVSGYVTKQTVANMQYWLKKRGYYSWGREHDGIWGYWTTYAVQGYLRSQYKWGYPKERYYAGQLDGQFGDMTKAALGDAAMYLAGGSTWMNNYCGAGDCWLSWPNINVVKSWQRFLNGNTP